MSQKLGEKIGQIDIHKKPKSSIGDVIGGVLLIGLIVLIVVGILS